MPRLHLLTSGLSVSLVLASAFACRTAQTEHAETLGAVDEPDETDAQADAKITAPPAPEQIEIRRDQRRRGPLREAELDPRGRAALSLDTHGGVLLWPTLDGGEGPEAAPYTLPVREPLWMSLATRDPEPDAKSGWTVAFIDTANGGLVGRIVPEDREAGTPARFVEGFRLPPGDPLFELHVLDGGERILALGIDHRVRLYDAGGELLSTLDEPGFAPWQLRVSGGVGEAPKLAVVLAQPLRVQSLELDGDELKIAGEARTIALDRGPNRNDLALSPDGGTLALLRRPHAHGRQWSIELVDLATDERKLIAGRDDTPVRGRMHFVADDRILLESGSGRGYWIELAKAVVPEDPADTHPDSRLAKRLSKSTDHPHVDLAGSAEPRWRLQEREDSGLRMHASVRNGVRVALIREGDRLVAADLDAPEDSVALGQRLLVPIRAGFSSDGETVAWAGMDQLYVEGLAGAGELVVIEHELGRAHLVAFVDDGHVLLASEKQAALIDLSDGQTLASQALERDWGLAKIAYHPSEPGAGVLAWSDQKPGSELRAIEVGADSLTEAAPLTRSERDDWLDIRELGDTAIAELLGRLDAEDVGEVDVWAATATGRYLFTNPHGRTKLHVVEADARTELALPAGQGRAMVPSPDGRQLAILQVRKHRQGFRRFGEDLMITVVDLESLERRWTRGVLTSAPTVPLSWSPDGRRLAAINVSTGVGAIYDGASGDLLIERSLLGVEVDGALELEGARE